MRIFYASHDTPNAFFRSQIWRENLYKSLVQLGHEVVEFQYDLTPTFQHLDTKRPEHLAFIARNRPLVTRELLRQLKTAHGKKPVDLFFSYFYDACILPEALEEIRRMGIRSVNWFCNAAYQLYLVQEIAPHYDYCLVPEKSRLEDYRKLGARPLYCQEAANPEIYKPYSLSQGIDVSFVGQCYGDRPAYIRFLVEHGIDARVWGIGWSKHFDPLGLRSLFRKWRDPGASARVGLPRRILGGVLTDQEMIKTYSRSKVNLGFSTCGTTHQDQERIVQIRLRDFEIPMSGGFYLVEHMEELLEFFEIGKEIETYRSREELLDKIRFFLKNDQARDKIRQAGRERCLRDHTWTKRFADAFARMGAG